LKAPSTRRFLSVDLPLKSFFWLGPLLFLIMHAYVLLHFVMLAGKVHVFDAQLRAQIATRPVIPVGQGFGPYVIAGRWPISSLPHCKAPHRLPGLG
jgi:hypothetical protein